MTDAERSMPKPTPTSSKEETNQPMTDKQIILKYMSFNTTRVEDRVECLKILSKLDDLGTNKIFGKDALEIIDITKRLTPLFQSLLTLSKATADASTQKSNESPTSK